MPTTQSARAWVFPVEAFAVPDARLNHVRIDIVFILTLSTEGHSSSRISYQGPLCFLFMPAVFELIPHLESSHAAGKSN